MLKVIVFLICFFTSCFAFADDQCISRLNLVTILPVDIKDYYKAAHGDPCRAVKFIDVLKDNGSYEWLCSKTEGKIIMSGKEASVVIYWVHFKKKGGITSE